MLKNISEEMKITAVIYKGMKLVVKYPIDPNLKLCGSL